MARRGRNPHIALAGFRVPERDTMVMNGHRSACIGCDGIGVTPDGERRHWPRDVPNKDLRLSHGIKRNANEQKLRVGAQADGVVEVQPGGRALVEDLGSVARCRGAIAWRVSHPKNLRNVEGERRADLRSAWRSRQGHQLLVVVGKRQRPTVHAPHLGETGTT